MSEEGEKEGRGFTVIDRRGAREDEEAQDRAASRSEEAPPGAPAGEPAAGHPRSGPRPEIPKIDFATFVLSLGTSAFYHMGLAPDPAGEGAPERNLLLARQTIDTIEMLEAKTRGNLDPEEAHLLESLLYELRMRFVESSRKAGADA